VLYTVKEVSEILKTNVSYVHNLRKSGLLPFIKLGTYKVRKETLEEFLARYENYDLTDPNHIRQLSDIENRENSTKKNKCCKAAN